MSEADQLRRLCEERSSAPDALRSLLDAAQKDAPNPAELEILWHRVDRSVTAQTGAIDGAGSTGSEAAGVPTAKGKLLILLGIAIVLAGGAGTLYAIRVAPAESEADSASSMVTPEIGATPSAPNLGPLPEEQVRAEQDEPPAREVAARESIPTAAEANSKLTATKTDKANRAKKANTEKEPEPPVSQIGEGALLLRARKALNENPRFALLLTAEHQKLYPRGKLIQERELIAIDALLRLSRRPEARARAVQFRARFPSSPHLGKVERLIGG